jgi:hypothetical protein
MALFYTKHNVMNICKGTGIQLLAFFHRHNLKVTGQSHMPRPFNLRRQQALCHWARLIPWHLCSPRFHSCTHEVIKAFFIARQPQGSQGLLTVEASRSHSTLSRTPWKSDQPDAETSTWQYTTLITDRHPCHLRDSNLHFQQTSGHRSTP